MTEKGTQARLRLATSDGKSVEPRMYAQSTSDRMLSQRTAPELSRSNAITSLSPKRCPVESTLRMYATVVPERLANDSCSSVGREFKYARSGSAMQNSLPNSKAMSIPFGQLLQGNGDYDSSMSTEETRRNNFRRLLQEKYNGSPKQFEVETGYSANMATQLRSGKKDFGEKVARKIESMAKLKPLALDESHAAATQERRQKAAPWPLTIDQTTFESLPPRIQRELDEAFTKMVLGAQTQEMLNKQRRHG